MTYQEFIQNIIATRGQWNILKGEYFEKHHIIPRCLNGLDDKENIIYLYAQEHYMAHKLLAEENVDNDALQYAWIMMAYMKDSHGRKYNISSDDYAILRKIHHDIAVKNNTGNKNPMYGKNAYANKTPEEMALISEKKRLKESGKNNPAYGRHWYTNGVDTVYLYDCPEGYWPGSSNYKNGGTHWYNNGINSKQYLEGREPEGWVKGRLPYSEEAINNMKIGALKRHKNKN